MQYILHSVLYQEEQTASNTVGEQNRQNRQNKQNRTAYKSGGTRVRARRRRFKERSDRATPPGARAATGGGNLLEFSISINNNDQQQLMSTCHSLSCAVCVVLGSAVRSGIMMMKMKSGKR